MTESVQIDDSNRELVEVSEQELSGYEIVANLLKRQDDVLVQLDELNDRVEAVIQAIVESRSAAVTPEAGEENEAADLNGEIPCSKAA